MSAPLISVVIPAYNAATVLPDCLRSLRAQSLPADQFEIVVADDGSRDGTADTANGLGARVVQILHAGGCAARNAGNRAAQGEWIAFTDADCLPTRNWLRLLLAAARTDPPPLGVAGAIMGYQPTTPAERFVELNGGIDVARHASHPTFAYPHHANALYRRAQLLAVGGLDERFAHYPGPDLHHRLRAQFGGELAYAPNAVVLHRHPATWRHFARQQHGYGVGYAQLLLRYRDELQWSLWRELRAWLGILRLAAVAALAADADTTLLRRGRLRKEVAFRRGFLRTYWNPVERRTWALP